MTETSTTYYPGHTAGTDPDRVAVVMADSGASMTYAELDAEANRLSHYLRQLGLDPGGHVAICMENRLEFLAVIWGCHYAGLYYTAISTRLTSGEMAYIVNDCGAEVFITSPSMTEQALSLLADTPRVRARLTVGGPVVGHIALQDAIGSMPSEPLEGRLEATDMLYSSGTTGQPKGVKAPASNEPLGTMPALLRIAQPFLGIVDGCTYLSPAPLYHGAPLRFCLSVLRVGGTVIVMERFDPERCLALIEQHRVTTSQFVPTMFVRMLKLDTAARSRYELSSLTHVVVASAPCPVEVKERMIDWWGPVIHEYYAGTEGNGFCYISSEEWLTHKGSVGRPLLGDVHIVGDDGRELPVGEEGGVYFGNGIAFEYHNDAAKTAGSRLANGWTTLGDIGRVDTDGYLYLTDRKAFMIISGGVNVYPQEAENVLTMHPKVLDVAVFGVPNADFGEEVKAVVQPVAMPADGPAAAALSSELIEYCRAQLADVKCPRSVDFREELPRHPTGKLYKRLLKDEYWAQTSTDR